MIIHFIDFISTTITNVKLHVYLCCKRFKEQLALNSCHILQNIYIHIKKKNQKKNLYLHIKPENDTLRKGKEIRDGIICF